MQAMEFADAAKEPQKQITLDDSLAAAATTPQAVHHNVNSLLHPLPPPNLINSAPSLPPYSSSSSQQPQQASPLGAGPESLAGYTNSTTTCFFQADPQLRNIDARLCSMLNYLSSHGVSDAALSTSRPSTPQCQPNMISTAFQQPGVPVQPFTHYRPPAAQELAYYSSLATGNPATGAASPYMHCAPAAALPTQIAQNLSVPTSSNLGNASIPQDPSPPPRRRRGRPRGSTASKRATAPSTSCQPVAPHTAFHQTTPIYGRHAYFHPPVPGEANVSFYVQPFRHPVPQLPAPTQMQLECAGQHAEKQEGSKTEGGGGGSEEEEVVYAIPNAPGVRFQPTARELIWYLNRKYLGRKLPVNFIIEFNVYKADPETIRAHCGECVDGFWYVFSPRKRRYQQGNRPARSDGARGFWKSNTKESNVKTDGKIIGKMNGLAHENGHQPKGMKTGWKMKEYRIPENQRKKNPADPSMLLDEWVICQICFKHAAKSHKSKIKDLQLASPEVMSIDEHYEDGSRTDEKGNNAKNGGASSSEDTQHVQSQCTATAFADSSDQMHVN